MTGPRPTPHDTFAYGDPVRVRNRAVFGTVAGVYLHEGSRPDPDRDVVTIRRDDGTTYADLATNVVRWVDHDGTEVKTRCFDERHAARLQESLDAAGLPNERATSVRR
jgi:hypothetical protein